MTNTRAYRSKIGSLPWAMRNTLNHMLRDGRTGTEALTFINTSKEWRTLKRATKQADVNAQNLTDWRTTGYADWLAEQAKTEHIRQLASLSQQIIEQSGGDPAAVGSRILAGNLLTCLESADPTETLELAKALTALRREENYAKKTDIAESHLTLKSQQLDLNRQKYQRQTCDLFLKWFKDKSVNSIINNKSTNNDAKTEALGRHLFGEYWDNRPPTNQPQ